MSAPRRSIVVMHPGGLGDVLLSLGALTAMRAGFPNHELVLFAESEVGTLLTDCGVIDQVRSIGSGEWSTLFAGGEQVLGEQRELFRRCDLLVGWLNDHTGSLNRTM